MSLIIDIIINKLQTTNFLELALTAEYTQAKSIVFIKTPIIKIFMVQLKDCTALKIMNNNITLRFLIINYYINKNYILMKHNKLPRETTPPYLNVNFLLIYPQSSTML